MKNLLTMCAIACTAIAIVTSLGYIAELKRDVKAAQQDRQQALDDSAILNARLVSEYYAVGTLTED